MRVFKPFGWDSWGLIVLSLILTGVVYWVLEFDAPEGEKQFEHTISGGIASVRETFQGFVEYGIVGFAPGTTGGKIVACGFGFFLLILHSTYTANLAAILNNLQQQADLESLEGAENQPYSICIARTSGAGMREMYQKVNWAHDPRDCQCCQEVVVDGVLLKYDEATKTYDSGYCQNKRTCEADETCAAGILEREDILPLVKSGHCKAAVMAKQDLIVEQAEGRYCEMKAVGNGLEMVYRGFPVRAEIAAAVRHYIVQSRGDGTLGNIFLDNDPTGDDRKYMDSKYEGEAMPPMCEINDGEEETDSDDESSAESSSDESSDDESSDDAPPPPAAKAAPPPPANHGQCMICLSQIGGGDAHALDCDHVFHADCLKSLANCVRLATATRRSAVVACPLCRRVKRTEMDMT